MSPDQPNRPCIRPVWADCLHPHRLVEEGTGENLARSYNAVIQFESTPMYCRSNFDFDFFRTSPSEASEKKAKKIRGHLSLFLPFGDYSPTVLSTFADLISLIPAQSIQKKHRVGYKSPSVLSEPSFLAEFLCLSNSLQITGSKLSLSPPVQISS